MSSPQINTYSDPARVAEAAAVFFAYLLPWQEKVTVALSGGSTPMLLFQHLYADYRDRLDWSKVHFFWGDERCVPPDHPESNYGVAEQLLLHHPGIPPANIHRIRGEADPVAEAKRYAEELKEAVPLVNGVPAFDLLLLGMGDDGHTASIFPDQLSLLTTPEWCAVAHHPVSGQARITLTGQVLNNAHRVAFLVTGAGKAGRVREVLMQEGDWRQFPAAHVRPTHGQLYWFLDDAAAGL